MSSGIFILFLYHSLRKKFCLHSSRHLIKKKVQKSIFLVLGSCKVYASVVEHILRKENMKTSSERSAKNETTSRLSRSRTVLLISICGTAYVVWGALISLQPPFYPTVAESKGATPSQVRGIVAYFAITNYISFLSSMGLCLELRTWLHWLQPHCLVHVGRGFKQSTYSILEHSFKQYVPSALGFSFTLTMS